MADKDNNKPGNGAGSDHVDGHHCGCDHDCSCDGGEDEVLTLIDENGEERNFTVIDILEVEGTEYAILLPVDEESDEAIILRFEKKHRPLLFQRKYCRKRSAVLRTEIFMGWYVLVLLLIQYRKWNIKKS